MKRTLLLSTVALGIAILPLGAAQAQDGLVPPYVDPFAGPYIGAHAGWFSGEVNVVGEYETFGGPIDGFIGGVLAGYNFPHAAGGNVMFGLEADFGWGHIDGDGVVMEPCLDCEPEIYPYNLDWDAHFRGRALFGQGNVRPFVAGGLALANLEIGEEYIYEGTFAGLSLGAGVDAQLGTRLVGRLEALYDWYCDKEVEYERSEWGTVGLSGLTVRAALILKLGP